MYLLDIPSISNNCKNVSALMDHFLNRYFIDLLKFFIILNCSFINSPVHSHKERRIKINLIKHVSLIVSLVFFNINSNLFNIKPMNLIIVLQEDIMQIFKLIGFILVSVGLQVPKH